MRLRTRITIQCTPGLGTAWTRCSIWRQHYAMPPKLADYELETVARAARALAHTERRSAEQIRDPALRAPVAKRAKCAAALAERFERARKTRS